MLCIDRAPSNKSNACCHGSISLYNVQNGTYITSMYKPSLLTDTPFSCKHFNGRLSTVLTIEGIYKVYVLIHRT